ncbi:MAG: lipocalin-like domain-containing protein [Chthoniobacterales bacterium]
MMHTLYGSALYLVTSCLFTDQSAGDQSALPTDSPAYHGLASEARSTSGDPTAFSALTPEGWRLAEPGYQFRFPQDHGPHPDYRTEWWYLTGNLQTADGREFGYELTFFRYGYRSPRQRTPVKSRFVVDDVKFAHFTVTDVRAKSFHVAERTSRGAYGDAGFLSGSRLAWIGDWELDLGQGFAAKAENNGCAIDLDLEPERSPVFEGENGYSRKASSGDHASEYYSITRMRTHGSVVIAGQKFQVTGLSWFDREWSTNQLAANQVGWNWFGIQMDDGSDLMLYQIRMRDGGIDPCSSGKWIDRDGHAVDIANGEFVLQPTRFWTTADKQATYPIGWHLKIEKLGFDAEINTPVENQELNVGVRYWEGCVRIKGTRNQQSVNGKGYLELTGFAGGTPGLGESSAK